MDLVLNTRVEGRYTVVEAVGEIDVYTAPVLRERFLSLVGAGDHHLILDLDRVAFCDSAGLAVLVQALNWVRAHDGSLSLVCTRENILKVFRITGLAQMFGCHPGVVEAAAAGNAAVATLPEARLSPERGELSTSR